MIVRMPDVVWPSVWSRSAARMWSCWACRAAGFRWPSKSPRRSQPPLDVLVVRRLGVPFQPELAFGAIAEAGVRVINDAVLAHTGVTAEEIAGVEDVQQAELRR